MCRITDVDAFTFDPFKEFRIDPPRNPHGATRQTGQGHRWNPSFGCFYRKTPLTKYSSETPTCAERAAKLARLLCQSCPKCGASAWRKKTSWTTKYQESRQARRYPRTLILENDSTARPEVGRPIDIARRNGVKISIRFTCGRSSSESFESERMR